MNIDSSSKDAARRNLVTLSTLFILFWFAEGHLTPDTMGLKVNLPYIPITFGQPEYLKYFAWFMLGWFLVRFWQFSRHKVDWLTFTEAIYYSWVSKKMMRKELKSTHLAPRSNQNPFIDKYGAKRQPVLFGDWSWEITRDNTDVSEDFVISKFNIFKKVILFAWVSITTEHFGQFYLPYLLAFFAIGLTAISSVK